MGYILCVFVLLLVSVSWYCFLVTFFDEVWNEIKVLLWSVGAFVLVAVKL